MRIPSLWLGFTPRAAYGVFLFLLNEFLRVRRSYIDVKVTQQKETVFKQINSVCCLRILNYVYVHNHFTFSGVT